MNRPALKTLWQLWWAPLLCFALAGAVGLTGFVQKLEWRTLDWRTEFRAYFQRPPDPRIAVVLFEDNTEAFLGKPWPVDRQYHGQMTQVLALAGAKTIAWDVILDASMEGEGDAAMGQIVQAAVESGTDVISAAVTNPEPTGAKPGKEGPTRPLPNIEGDISQLVGDEHAFIPFPQLRAVSLYGFADTPPGPDGIRRDVPLVVRVGKVVYPTLSLQTLLAYYRISPDQVRVSLGDAIRFPADGRLLRLPISRSGCFRVNYRYDYTGSLTDFPIYSYGDTLFVLSARFLENKLVAGSHMAPKDLSGKIVFLGQIVTGKADSGPSPLNGYAALTLIHANIVNNVLAGDFAREVPAWIIWGLALIAGYGWIAFLGDRSVFLLCCGCVLSILVYVVASVWLWVWLSWDLALVAPLGGMAALQFTMIGRRVLQEQRAKQEIKGMFGTYVSPDLVDRMIKSGQPPRLGGHTDEITAHFSDIQSFSTFSELMPPERLVELMNEYLTACTDIVQAEGGTLDKYIGDAVVVMFGAPVPLPDHAYRACVAALREQKAVAELRVRWAGEGGRWPPVVTGTRVRIGLNTGPATIGNMGSRTRFNYTMMGDNVNLGARMESGAKSWGAYTMCTESTRLACLRHGGDRIVFRPLGSIMVKGRSQPVPIHEVVGLREEVDARTLECLGVFAQALGKYHARDFAGAASLFGRSALLEPRIPERDPGIHDNPSLVYIRISEHYAAEPPPADWDGVYVMKEK